MKKVFAFIIAAGAASATLPAAAVNLANITGNTTLDNGDVATGTLAGEYKISVAAGATVTLRNAVIKKNTGWACVNCIGNATIVLEGENTLYPLTAPYPAIHVPVNKTLTIQGSGSLAARGGSGSAAIGSGNQIDCGNIVIAGGTITATNSGQSAAIGSGVGSACGNITISGGNVTSVDDGNLGNGIGAGINGTCGDILISGGTVYADGGNFGAGIGCCGNVTAGGEIRCGNITISGGNVTAISGVGAAAIGSALGYAERLGQDYINVSRSVCGDITISGGIVNAIVRPTATASYASVGIGAGIQHASCGNITIGPGVTRVTATCCTEYPTDESRCIPIGATKESTDNCNVTCGTVTIDPHLFDETHETAATANPDVVTLTRTISHDWDGNLAMLKVDVTIDEDMTIFGTLGGNYKVSIADGVTVTVSNAVINGVNQADYEWAGINCEGSATIVLKGTNTIRGFDEGYPGILVPTGKTLTIRGDGSLAASSNGFGAGVGGGFQINCGNIVIEGGTITATGGDSASGIGGGCYGACGDISITGGTITATGGESAAGIGAGFGGSCGDITIGAGIVRVTATAGDDCNNPVGAGAGGTCGTVTLAEGLYDYTIGRTRTISRNWDGNLAALSRNVTADRNMTVYGTLAGNYKVSIADGMTVTLSNAVINGVSEDDYKWAGITCEGDATIVLAGTNTVRGFGGLYPGIFVPPNKTLTILGSGVLTVTSNGNGAGIGGGYQIDCGNIVIAGGTVTAIGSDGLGSTGIGSSLESSCGDITISGGTVTATGGAGSAAIGCGSEGFCGGITISGGVVYATSLGDAAAIGICAYGTCGDIVIGQNVALVVATGSANYSYAIDGDSVSVHNTLSDYIRGSTRMISTCDLGMLAGNVTFADGSRLTGALSGNYKVSIADGADVTLDGVYISGANDAEYAWAGITCEGNATLRLSSVNYVRGFYEDYPGIYVPTNKTLTITGDDFLTAESNGYGAGIGGGYGIDCGNIVIEEGEITATGGDAAAGIGAGRGSSCGNISLVGGTITATGGDYAAGIGSGWRGECGDVLIDSGITRVVATCANSNIASPVGAGFNGSCGNVTMDAGLLSMTTNGGKTRTIIPAESSGNFDLWESGTGVTGSWNYKDANGIANVFRYAFDVPTGAFALIGIEFNDAGKAVIITPPLVNAEGFAFSVVASDALDGTGNAASYPLEADGTTLINETVSGSRFFRLRAVEE